MAYSKLVAVPESNLQSARKGVVEHTYNIIGGDMYVTFACPATAMLPRTEKWEAPSGGRVKLTDVVSYPRGRAA